MGTKMLVLVRLGLSMLTGYTHYLLLVKKFHSFSVLTWLLPVSCS